jgi:hypothetical protein
LSEESLTKSKLAAVIRAVGRWKNLARQYEMLEVLTRIEDVEGKLKGYIERLEAEMLNKGADEGGKCVYLKTTNFTEL